jgi:hypothetical protein
MAAPSRCLSSHVMSYLVAWRNPQGREEGWMNRPQTFPGLATKLISAGGFCILTAGAAVETVAYSAIAVLTLTIYPLTDRPFQYAVKLLESSSFTALWSLADGLLINWFFPNLLTHESLARGWSGFVNPTRINLFRFEDRIYVAEWQIRLQGAPGHPLLDGLARQGANVNKLINDGAAFITESIIAKMDESTLDLFKTKDAKIFMYVLTQAVFIYAFGSKLQDEIPMFFKEETREGIMQLRFQNPLSKEIQEELNRKMENLISFDEDKINQSAQTLFNELRKIGYQELHNSLFVNHCWDKAASSQPAESSA